MKKFVLSALLLNFLASTSYALPFIAASDWIDNNKPIIFSDDFQKKIFPLSTVELAKPDSRPLLNKDSAIACNDDQCIAVGQYEDIRGFVISPMVLQSHDEGKAWVELSEGDQNSDDSIYYSGQGCTDKMCMIVKITSNYDEGYAKLAIAMRNNKDTLWTYPESAERLFPYKNPKQIAIFDVSCQGAVCNIVGNYYDSNKNIYPLLIHSSDNGVTWSYPAIKTHYEGEAATLFTVNCQGANCLASGRIRNKKEKDAPLLFTSNDNGVTWAESYVPPIPKVEQDDKAIIKGHFIENSRCSASFCVAVGNYGYGFLAPLLMVSYDKGASWFYPQAIIDKFPHLEHVRFFGLSVEGNVGLASGFYERSGERGIYYPILARTVDAGRTWDYIFPNDYPKNAFLFEQLSFQKGHFFSVGEIDRKAAIVMSDDSGLTWSYVSLNVSGNLSSFLNSKKCPTCFIERKQSLDINRVLNF